VFCQLLSFAVLEYAVMNDDDVVGYWSKFSVSMVRLLLV